MIEEKLRELADRAGLELRAFEMPDHLIRAGVILDRLAARKTAEPARRIGRYEFDPAQSVLQSGDETIRLTEKEAALLRILHDAGGKSIARDALLEQVWEYNEGVETHTLETHIYRLRQKIEADPGAPQILMTDEDGYFLSF